MKVRIAVLGLMLGAFATQADDLLKPTAGQAPPVTELDAPIEGLADTAGQVEAEGRVLAVNPGSGTLTVAQEALPALGWPALTVRFEADPALLRDLAPGMEVAYSFRSARGAARIEQVQQR